MGIPVAILSALAYAAGAVFVRFGLVYLNPLPGTLISVFASFTSVLLIALFLQPEALLSLSLVAVLWFALIGLINFALGRYLSSVSTNYIGVSRASSVRSTSPLFTLVLAIIFLGERPTLPLLIGTLLTAFGLYLLMSEE